MARKQKWVAKLKMISDNAQQFLPGRGMPGAGIPEAFDQQEFEEITKVVLSAGAYKTIKGHVM